MRSDKLKEEKAAATAGSKKGKGGRGTLNMGKGGAAGELAECMRGVCVVKGGRWEWRADWGVVWCAGMRGGGSEHGGR